MVQQIVDNYAIIKIDVILSERAMHTSNPIVQYVNRHYMPTHLCVNIKGKESGSTVDTFES